MSLVCSSRGCEHVLSSRYPSSTGMCPGCLHNRKKAEIATQDLWGFYKELYYAHGNQAKIRKKILDEFVHEAALVWVSPRTGTYIGTTKRIVEWAYPISQQVVTSSWHRLEDGGMLVKVSDDEWIVKEVEYAPQEEGKAHQQHSPSAG